MYRHPRFSIQQLVVAMICVVVYEMMLCVVLVGSVSHYKIDISSKQASLSD